MFTIVEYKNEIDSLEKHLAGNDMYRAYEIVDRLLGTDNLKIKYLLGYYLVSAMYDNRISKISTDFYSYGISKITERFADCLPIKIRDKSHGAHFEINLDCFEEEEPLFAYCDDCGSKVSEVTGLSFAGITKIDREPWMWLDETRKCVLFKVDKSIPGRAASILSAASGEFCTEIYHCRDKDVFVLISREDFCFK